MQQDMSFPRGHGEPSAYVRVVLGWRSSTYMKTDDLTVFPINMKIFSAGFGLGGAYDRDAVEGFKESLQDGLPSDVRGALLKFILDSNHTNRNTSVREWAVSEVMRAPELVEEPSTWLLDLSSAGMLPANERYIPGPGVTYLYVDHDVMDPIMRDHRRIYIARTARNLPTPMRVELGRLFPASKHVIMAPPSQVLTPL